MAKAMLHPAKAEDLLTGAEYDVDSLSTLELVRDF
jgi:hypothetical protein